MRMLLDADALIKLASSSAKEEYLEGVEAFTSPPAAREATRGPSSGRTPDSILVERNIGAGRLRIAGGGAGRDPPPVRPGEDGDAGTIGWASSPGFDLVVTDDRHLIGRLRLETDKASSVCESIVFLVNAGVHPQARGIRMLAKLAGRVRERERAEAMRALGGQP